MALIIDKSAEPTVVPQAPDGFRGGNFGNDLLCGLQKNVFLVVVFFPLFERFRGAKTMCFWLPLEKHGPLASAKCPNSEVDLAVL